MADSIHDEFNAIAVEIQNAHWAVAQERLKAIKTSDVPHSLLHEYAALCRRANIPELGLHILRPIVRPSGRKIAPANDELRLEYAACLNRLGACSEAKKLFEKIEPGKFPDLYIMRARLHLKLWEYPKAIPLLKTYLSLPSIAPYDRTIGLLNLGLCLIFEEDFAAALDVLNEVLTLDNQSRVKLVTGNAYRLLGTLEFKRQNYEVAIQCLRKAMTVFENGSGIDAFLTRKWIVLSECLLQKDNPFFKSRIQTLLEEAKKLRHWESVRDIEYQVALHEGDIATLTKIYFGTPYSHFKDRLRKKCPHLELPPQYLWQLSPEAKGKQITLRAEDIPLKQGQVLHRLFRTLASDLYRPFQVMDLFDQLTPDAYYAFGNSEQRIYQTVSRLRLWFEENKIPLDILNDEKAFYLGSTQNVTLILTDSYKVETQEDGRLILLRQELRDSFTIHDAKRVLDVADRTAGQVLKAAVQRGILEKTGKASQTRYRFTVDTTQFKKSA